MKTNDIPECGLSYTLKLVGGKWKPTILWELHTAPLRFGELKRRLSGISDKVCSEQLKELERDGLVERRDFSGNILHVDYKLTASGLSLNEALHCLSFWGTQHRDSNVRTLEPRSF